MKTTIPKLRKIIRNVLLEMKIPKHELFDVEGIDWKKTFQEKADQNSLQKLAYIHWCDPQEAMVMLKASGKDEVSTAIHSRRDKLVPWGIDETSSEISIGLELEGWITFAANMDLQSGRFKDKFYGPVEDMHPWKQWQAKTSGFPKRPYVDGYLRGSGAWRTKLPNQGIIYKEEDLVVRDSYKDYQWPEAILDNWKVVRIWWKEDGSYKPLQEKLFKKVQDAAKSKGIKILDIGEW